MELTDYDFRTLMDMRKIFTSNINQLPSLNEKKIYEVSSIDGNEMFLVDVDRSSRIEIKSKTQKRYGGNIPIIRIEINSPPHTNPNGEQIGRDHIHIYKEGFELSWAFDLDGFHEILFRDTENFTKLFQDFCKYCNIEVDTDYQVVI